MTDKLAEIEAHLEDDRKAAIRDRMGAMPMDVSHRAWLIAALKVERAERKRLAELIDDTAKHWLDLQSKYPIRWEGAIDNAMQAACSEILQLLDLVAGSGRKILECAQLQLRAEDAEAALRESRVAADAWKNEALMLAAHQGIDNYQRLLDDAVKLRESRQREALLQDDAEKLRWALRLVLPLAKSFAFAGTIKSNYEVVAQAEAIAIKDTQS